MFNWPHVTIQICTYNRYYEIRQTIDSLIGNLKYPADRIHWLICDDSTGVHYIDSIFSDYSYIDRFKVISTPQRSGWGINVNRGMEEIETDYIFFTEDDYVLRQEIDIGFGVALMEAEPSIGMVRFDGIAGHLGLHLELNEFWTEAPLRHGVQPIGKLNYFRIMSSSTHAHIYSNRPHLKHRRFHEFHGPYPEGMKLWRTEMAMLSQVKERYDNANAPQIAVFPEGVHRIHDDIGDTYQHTEDDIGE